MLSKVAAKYIRRIEDHREAEDLIWREMRARDDYKPNEDRDIRDILEVRAKGREAMAEADARLAGFDYQDEDA